VYCHIAGAMDMARVEARVDQAVQEFGVSGKGVLVAIMDRGIDWENADFRNEDGTTRIEYLFDLTDDRGAKRRNPYKVGTIYTKKEINEALEKGEKLATWDNSGHGTTTTGIASSNGRNSPDRKYRGIAPEASLLVVKICTDPTPAFNGKPAVENVFDGNRIPVAIDFIAEKARELKMPCVMLLNIGSQGGPTDGTSELCRKIDATVGPGIPGLVFVTGPGDDGGRDNRAGGTIKQGEDLELKIRKESETPITVQVWYPDEDLVEISVRTPKREFGPYPEPTRSKNRETEERNEFALYHNAGDARDTRPANEKRQIFLQIKGPPGEYALILHGKRIKNGRFNATIGPNAPAATWPPFNSFLNHLEPGSIWDGATARHNICPGDYVVRTEWTDIDGNPGSQLDQGKPGELWTGSSTGPTFDGRLGVDVCAPGDSVFTTYNPSSYWATFRGNLIHDGKGLYGRASAVSASAPLATGIIALMLQMNPKLDAMQVKEILQRTARADEFTGKTPNPSWGYGKVDAHAALTAVKDTLPGGGR